MATDEITQEDIDDVELTDEQNAEIDRVTEATTKAMGSDVAAESVGLGLVTDALAENNAIGETAIVAVRDELIAQLERYAEGIDTFTLDPVPVYRFIETKDADGNVTGRTRTVERLIEGGEFRLITFTTLTGERRRTAHRIVTGMGGYVMRIGGGASQMMAAASAMMASDHWVDLVGALYRPVDGRWIDPEDFEHIGRAIDEHLTTERVVGVLHRFFSSSGPSSGDGILTFLKRLLATGTNWISGLKIAGQSVGALLSPTP